MAVNKRLERAYGFGQGIYQLSPQPIIAQRAPTTSDMAEIGTIWCDQANNSVYTLVSVVANSASWQTSGGGSSVVNSLTVNNGPTILNGALTVNPAGNAVNIATDMMAATTTIGNNVGNSSVVVNVGTGAASFGANGTVHTTTVGSTAGASTTTLQGGTGGTNVTSTGQTTISSSQANSPNAVYINSTGAAGGVTVQALGVGSTGIALFTPATSGIQIGNTVTPAAGIYVGQGAPNFAASTGSIYLNTSATTSATRLYINDTVGGTPMNSWTNFTSAA
jgi:hypothetical protein